MAFVAAGDMSASQNAQEVLSFSSQGSSGLHEAFLQRSGAMGTTGSHGLLHITLGLYCFLADIWAALWLYDHCHGHLFDLHLA